MWNYKAILMCGNKIYWYKNIEKITPNKECLIKKYPIHLKIWEVRGTLSPPPPLPMIPLTKLDDFTFKIIYFNYYCILFYLKVQPTKA